ncbi:hypothetical protein LARV_03658 [Longilinea arvoryzae]|uniref:Uncharacterized protein n=1 Tax=Longilinea arvoryzae TaxID=360412 RepID=A0A0S7BJN7_9CHLR|nr:hypothetical protein LARV_03658 [Longilinea arvoryzae]
MKKEEGARIIMKKFPVEIDTSGSFFSFFLFAPLSLRTLWALWLILSSTLL